MYAGTDVYRTVNFSPHINSVNVMYSFIKMIRYSCILWFFKLRLHSSKLSVGHKPVNDFRLIVKNTLSFYFLFIHVQIDIHKPSNPSSVNYEDAPDKCVVATHGRDCQFRNGFCKKTNNLCSWELFPSALQTTNCVQVLWTIANS